MLQKFSGYLQQSLDTTASMMECEETWFTDKMSHMIVSLRVCGTKLLFHLLPESEWSLPMAWREANMMTCYCLPTGSFTVDLCRAVLPIEGRIIFFFFHFLRGFFRCLIILLSVSSCLCQQMSHQLDLTFLCSLADGESVWPWWLLLCKVRQALPLPCIWCINPSALALCTCFRINTESSYSISLFLLFFESSLTEVSYFIQIMQKPLQSICSVFTSCLTVWSIFLPYKLTCKDTLLLHTVLLTIK